jgi:hypothetical protein
MSIALTGIFSFLIPMLFLGYNQNILLYQGWIHAMREHSNYLSSHHTIPSLLHYYFGMQTGTWFTYFLIALVCTVYFFLYFFLNRKNESPSQFLFVTGYFCLLAIVPNIVITDTEHFLLSLPLIVILLRYVAEKKNLLLIAAFILLIFFYEGNSTDLLGKNLSQRFEEMGLLGSSNLIIVASVLLLVFRVTNKSLQAKED